MTRLTDRLYLDFEADPVPTSITILLVLVLVALLAAVAFVVIDAMIVTDAECRGVESLIADDIELRPMERTMLPVCRGRGAL